MGLPTVNINDLVKKIAPEVARVIFSGKEGLMQSKFANGLGKLENVLNKYERLDLKIGAQDFAPLGSIFYWDKILQNIKDVNQSLGIAGQLGMNMQRNFRGAVADLAALNISPEKGLQVVTEQYQGFINTLGRYREFASQDFVRLAEINKAFDVSGAEMFANFNMIGVSIEQTHENLKNVAVEAADMGLNMANVVKNINENFNMINKFSFRRGRLGLMEMAKYAERTKISMKSAANLADKIWEDGIEGSIDMAAQLQVLGGEFSQFGDAFQLQYLARNEPEEFQKNLAKIAQSYATFDREMGEYKIDPLGMDTLRKGAQILGLDFDELARSGKMMKKELDVSRMLDVSLKGANFDEIVSKVAGAAEFDKAMNDFVVSIDGSKELVRNLTREQINQLDVVSPKGEEDVFKDLIRSNRDLGEILQALVDELKIRMLSETQYEKIYGLTRNMADNIKASFESGMLAPFTETFKYYNEKSFENIMELIEPISKGNIGEAFSIGSKRMTDALSSILSTTLNLLKYMFVDVLGGMISNAIHNLGEKISFEIRSIFASGYAAPPNYRDKLEGVKPFNEFLKENLPEDLQRRLELLQPMDKKRQEEVEKYMQDFKSGENKEKIEQIQNTFKKDSEAQKNLQKMIEDMYRMKGLETTGQEWKGILRHEFPDKSITQKLSKEELNRLYGKIMKEVTGSMKGDNSAGGKSKEPSFEWRMQNMIII